MPVHLGKRLSIWSDRMIHDKFNSTDIQGSLDVLSHTGGVLNLTSGCYDIFSPLVPDVSSLCLDGGVWACNTDPNGVFESKCGTKLRAHGRNYPLVVMGRQCDPISGATLRNLGFQGDIPGMDTRPLVDFDHPEKAAGVCFDKVRTDQCEFSRLAFCGLANGITAIGNAELDACLFDGLNLDGCGNGVWFSPRASYYTRFRSCVVADNPYYGFYLGGKGKQIQNLELRECFFVRNGGAFNDDVGQQPAAVFFDGASQCAISSCIFDAPGTFWYYEEDATENKERQPSKIRIPALRIVGDQYRICNNTFLNSSAESIQVCGNGNILMGNIADGDVYICGEGNVVSSLVFTTSDARLVLEGTAKTTTILHGVEDWRVIRK